MPKYEVIDETGEVLRRFWTRKQARSWCVPGWKVRLQKFDIDQLPEALF